jgi:hypothetical protein
MKIPEYRPSGTGQTVLKNEKRRKLPGSGFLLDQLDFNTADLAGKDVVQERQDSSADKRHDPKDDREDIIASRPRVVAPGISKEAPMAEPRMANRMP